MSTSVVPSPLQPSSVPLQPLQPSTPAKWPDKGGMMEWLANYILPLLALMEQEMSQTPPDVNLLRKQLQTLEGYIAIIQSLAEGQLYFEISNVFQELSTAVAAMVQDLNANPPNLADAAKQLGYIDGDIVNILDWVLYNPK